MDTKREHRTHAEGSPRGNPYDLTYSPSGRLIGKFRDNNSVTLSATVDMAYGYCDDDQPHAVKRMFDYNNGMLYDMRWDEARNLGQVSIAKLGGMFEAGRFLFWTEDGAAQSERRANSFVLPSQSSVGVANRMHAAIDDKYYSYYAYDHSGGSCGNRAQSQACLSYAETKQRRRSQRRLKLTGDNKLLDVNADFMATYTILNEPTLYPSAYMVLTNKGYTKHYYAGTERVAARLGGGGLDALYHVIGNDEELQVKADMLFKQSLEQVNHRVLHENDLDCIMQNEFSKEEFGYWIDDIPHQMKAEVEIDHGQFKDMVNSMLDDINHGQEKEVYFYHSDHLGSASWITDFSGVAVQHIQYLPYGEPYIDQRAEGKVKSGNFENVEKYELPSLEARNKICDYVEESDRKDNLREYGGTVWENGDNGKQDIRYSKPGARWYGGAVATVNQNDYEGDFEHVGKRLLLYFHSHFSGEINGIGLIQRPSDSREDDLQGRKGDIQNVLTDNNSRTGGAKLSYNIMFAMKTKQVYFYTHVGVKFTMSFSDFRTLGGTK